MDNTNLDITVLKDMINIPEINKDSHFWMIRTKQGVFYDEYVSQEFIAIGWNIINKGSLTNITKGQTESIKTLLEKEYDEGRPQSAINKCQKFIFDVQEGDYVVIASRKYVTFAIAGEYYEEQGDLFTVENEISINEQIEHSSNKGYICPYMKRRKITTIKEIPTATLSPYLINNVIANHHSLSSLDEEAELVLSCCYDAFVWHNKLTCTFRVQKKEAINSGDYVTFLYYINELIDTSVPNHGDVSIKSNIHSPGEIILTCLNFVKDYWWAFALIYLFIFGGKIKDVELNSAVGLITKFIHRKETKRNTELDLQIKEEQLKKLRIENESAQIELDERKRELLETAYQKISQSSAALEIKDVDDKIIDFRPFLESGDTPDESK